MSEEPFLREFKDKIFWVKGITHGGFYIYINLNPIIIYIYINPNPIIMHWAVTWHTLFRISCSLCEVFRAIWWIDDVYRCWVKYKNTSVRFDDLLWTLYDVIATTTTTVYDDVDVTRLMRNGA